MIWIETAPNAAKRLKDPPHKANYISVQADGSMFLNKRKVSDAQGTCCRRWCPCEWMILIDIIVRGDGKTRYREIRAVLDVCQQANVPKVDLATEPLK